MKKIIIALLALVLVVGAGVVRADESAELDQVEGVFVLSYEAQYLHPVMSTRGFNFNIEIGYNKYTEDADEVEVKSPSFMIDLFDAEDLNNKTTLFFPTETCAYRRLGKGSGFSRAELFFECSAENLHIGPYFYVIYAFDETCSFDDVNDMRITPLSEEQIMSKDYFPTNPRYSLVVRPDISFDIHPSDQAALTSWLDEDMSAWFHYLDDEKCHPDLISTRMIEFKWSNRWSVDDEIDIYLMGRVYGEQELFPYDKQSWCYFDKATCIEADESSNKCSILLTLYDTAMVNEILNKDVPDDVNNVDHSFYFVFYNKTKGETHRSAPFLPIQY